jgi:UDP-N-acetylmuramate--alanine ligase
LFAAKSAGFERIIAVFQPHLYSRTRDFMDDFAGSLALADEVFVTGIYKSREDPIPGVSASSIVEIMKEKGYRHVRYIEKKENLIAQLQPVLKHGDAVVVMGAGDVGELCMPILERLHHD